MSTTLNLEMLHTQDVALTVPENQVRVLWPNDEFQAIGSPGRSAGCCLVLAGTSPGSAIIMANLTCPVLDLHLFRSTDTTKCLLDLEGHHMTLIRRVIGIFLRHQAQFQQPRAWIIFASCKSPVWADLVQHRAQRVFQHLGLQAEILECAVQTPEATISTPVKRTIIAFKHQKGLPEIYLGDQPLRPRLPAAPLTSFSEKPDRVSLEAEGSEIE